MDSEPLVTVVFCKSRGGHFAGDRCGFPEHVALELKAQGYVDIVPPNLEGEWRVSMTPEAYVEKYKGKDRAGLRPTVQATLALAERILADQKG